MGPYMHAATAHTASNMTCNAWCQPLLIQSDTATICANVNRFYLSSESVAQVTAAKAAFVVPL